MSRLELSGGSLELEVFNVGFGDARVELVDHWCDADAVERRT